MTQRSIVDDRRTFTMREFATKGRLELRCAMGTYFLALDTCDALEWEILSKATTTLRSSDEESFRRFDKQLPLRSALHKQVSDPIHDGSHRSVAIAVSTLVAYKNEGSFYLWIQKRSEEVAVHVNLHHVVPSFMFQPIIGFLDGEFSITHNIYREYLEELFNVSETPGAVHWKYFYNYPPLKILRNWIEQGTGEAELFFSGIAVNLLNLRPEICTVLLIRSEEWFKKYSQPLSEQEGFHLNSEFLGGVIPIPYKAPYEGRDKELMQQWPLKAKDMVPPGAAAFWLGVRLLDKVL